MTARRSDAEAVSGQAAGLRDEDRQLVDRVFYLAENLLQRVPEFTGVIGPGGEREDDYIRDSIGQELVEKKTRLAAALDERDTLKEAALQVCEPVLGWTLDMFDSESDLHPAVRKRLRHGHRVLFYALGWKPVRSDGSVDEERYERLRAEIGPLLSVDGPTRPPAAASSAAQADTGKET